jgi:LSD1 subclass zinc finger protein
MEVEDQATILLELKYCERCGELWVRPSGSEEVYCASCAIEMADLRFPAK